MKDSEVSPLCSEGCSVGSVFLVTLLPYSSEDHPIVSYSRFPQRRKKNLLIVSTFFPSLHGRKGQGCEVGCKGVTKGVTRGVKDGLNTSFNTVTINYSYRLL